MLVGLFAPDIVFLHEFPLTYYEQITVFRIHFENLVLTLEGGRKFKPNGPNLRFCCVTRETENWRLRQTANIIFNFTVFKYMEILKQIKIAESKKQ